MFEILDSALFSQIRRDELQSLLGCLNARVQTYAKGETIFLEGDLANDVGLVLSGSVQIIKEDYFGNRAILALAVNGELFAEAFACADEKVMGASAIAAEPSRVMLVDYARIVTTCPSSCPFHAKLIRNMLGILAEKNIKLSRKIEHTSKRTTREKLLSYLAEQAKQANSSRFSIPFDRQGLADYLGAERSAMSAELGRMREEGLLDFHKNHFELYSAR